MHYFEYTNSKIFSGVTPPNPLRLLGPKSRAFGARSFSHAFFFSTLGSYVCDQLGILPPAFTIGAGPPFTHNRVLLGRAIACAQVLPCQPAKKS